MFFRRSRTLIVLVAFILGASVSPAQDSLKPVAFLAANTLDGCQLYPMAVNGELSAPVLLENTICYSVEIPDDFDGDQPYFVNVSHAIPSPDSSRLAYVRHTAQNSPNDITEPGELVILNLQTGEPFIFPKPDVHWDVPVWSPDSQTLLFNQFTREPFETHIDIYDAVEGDSRTAISGIATGSYVQEIWISQDRFLLISWPDIYIGGRGERGTYKFVTLSAEDVDAPANIAERVSFGAVVWSNRDQKLYANVSNTWTDEPVPRRFSVLASLDLDGKFSVIIDYQVVFADALLWDPPRVFAESSDGALYVVSTDSENGDSWRIDRVWSGGFETVATREMRIDGATGYSLVLADVGEISPNGRYLAIGGVGGSRAEPTGLIYVLELATGRVILDAAADDPVCNVRWIDNAILSYSQLSLPWPGFFPCRTGASDSFVIHDVFADTAQTVALPDNRPFWLLRPRN